MNDKRRASREFATHFAARSTAMTGQHADLPIEEVTNRGEIANWSDT
jgi:hypothetical protein